MKINKVITGLSVLALCTALATPTLATYSLTATFTMTIRFIL
ncbi:hypothetical protein [Mesobacillus sp.]